MAITLRPDQEQRFLDAVRSGGYERTDDAMDTALEMLRWQNEWLLANHDIIHAKIQQGIQELDRGEGIAEDKLDAYLERLKANE
jgi:hypothetical protein